MLAPFITLGDNKTITEIERHGAGEKFRSDVTPSSFGAKA